MFGYKLFRISGVQMEVPGGGSGGGSDDLDETSRDLGDISADSDPVGDDDDDDAEKPDPKGASGKDDDEEEEEESEDQPDGDDEEEEDGDEEADEDDEEDRERAAKSGKKEPEPEGRVTFKTLKAEYPDLFKKHPELRTAFFEHPQYAEIFPDISSAKEAAAKAQDYDLLEQSMVAKGDPSVLIKALDENNPKALKKVIANFPEALRDADPAYYTELATPIVEELLYHASKHAEKIGGDPGRNLKLAAKHIANYVWANGGDIPDISKKTIEKEKGPSDAEKALVEERATYARREYARAADDIEAALKPTMDAVYSNKLGDLTRFERKQVIKEAKQEVDRLLSKDEGFQRTMKALWKRAHESGYSDASKTRIRRAWLERAQAIAPKVRNRLRQEAISGRKVGADPEDQDDKIDKGEKKVSDKKRQFTNQGGKSPSGKSSGSRDPKKIAWRTTSDMDILNS